MTPVFIWLLLVSFFVGVYAVYTTLCNAAAKGGPTHKRAALQPSVTLLICAYNEASRIPALMANLRQIEYPSTKLNVLFVNDNSTDQTPRLITEEAADFPFQVTVLDNPHPRGKTNALSFAYTQMSTEITMQTDADTLLDKSAVAELVKNFADPDVGGANGVIRILSAEPSGQLARQETMYRRLYDLWRRGESAIDSISICNGCIVAYRSDLVRDVSLGSMADDTELLFELIRRGKRVVYDEEAVAFEIIPTKTAERFMQKMRRSKGLFQVYLRNLALLGKPGFGRRVYPFVLLQICVLPYVFVAAMGFYSWMVVRDPKWLLCLLALVIPKVNTAAWNVIVTQLQIALSPFYSAGAWKTTESSRKSTATEDVRP